MKIGIIGLGRFGKLFYDLLQDEKVDLFGYDTDPQKSINSLEEILECNLIILAVPISKFEETLKSISEDINRKATVMDVCSVKVYPLEIMQKYLPESVDIIASHPMFGPDSTERGTKFEGLKFIYSTPRVKNYEVIDFILDFWLYKGVENIQMSPEEHDMKAAYTQLYSFLIGKIGLEMGIENNEVANKGFAKGIWYNQNNVKNDTHQLFLDMNKYNPYAKEMREKFGAAFEKIDGYLKEENND